MVDYHLKTPILKETDLEVFQLAKQCWGEVSGVSNGGCPQNVGRLSVADLWMQPYWGIQENLSYLFTWDRRNSLSRAHQFSANNSFFLLGQISLHPRNSKHFSKARCENKMGRGAGSLAGWSSESLLRRGECLSHFLWCVKLTVSHFSFSMPLLRDA